MWVREPLAGVLMGIQPVSKGSIKFGLAGRNGFSQKRKGFSFVALCGQRRKNYNIRRPVYANRLIKMTTVANNYWNCHEPDTLKSFTCVVFIY